MSSVNSSFWICPLYGFTYNVDDIERIELSSEVSIWRLPTDLLNDIDKNYPQLELQRNKVRWAVCFLYNPKRRELPSRETSTNTDKIAFGLKIYDDVREILFYCITTLRLYRKPRIEPSLLLLINKTKDEYHLGGTAVWSNLAKTGEEISLNDAKYVLTEKDVAGLREFWSDFYKKQKTGKLSGIQVALNRFNFSYSGSLEDRLLDQMIALENLYLGDNKELGYKMALRAAFVLANKKNDRSIVFSRLKKAYAARGNIVHANKPPKVNELIELYSNTGDYLRESIKHFVILLGHHTLKELHDKLLDQNIIASGRLLRKP